MQVDGDVEPHVPELARHREIVRDTVHAGPFWYDEHFVDIRVVPDDRFGERFDEIRKVGVRIRAAQGAQERCGEDDVADQAKADEQNLQGSIVASSISMTGMSSLIGYTR